jgi:hypothetical protein
MTQDSVLQDRTRPSSGSSLWVIGVVIGMFGGIALTQRESVGIGVVLLAIAAIIVLVGELMRRRTRQWGVPTLVVPPLRLGGVAMARYEWRGSTSQIWETYDVMAVMEGEERVFYQEGSTGRSSRHTIYHGALATTPGEIQHQVSAEIRIEVPLDAPPSISLRNNWITWRVLVTVVGPNLPSDEHTFVVTVPPIVAGVV